ncbi:DUF2268 domain-containing protein [Salimicrobium humidisoli]|uniref:DUF2268 domain-containing protein n=1 Tax=Salimicrobium humidisoli TaxID=2029857 RepID=A0ABX4HTC8_9BACI|nr:DUF2268 domain-containing putative Zn-dependent protease [Salimicrobium humidisoli]PBB06298.1 hypothetical protein CKW00_04515 [Salimicrobium humidisoli]
MNKSILFFLLFLLTVFTLGCSSSSGDKGKEKAGASEETDSQKNKGLEFEHNDQTFTVIPLFSQTLNYTEKVGGDSSKDRERLYQEYVISSFEDIAEEKDLEISEFYEDYFEYNTNIEELENSTKELMKQKDVIMKSVQSALKESSSKLSGTDKTIFVMPLNPTNHFPIYNLGGVTGVTLSEDTVIMKLDPSYEEEQLKYAVAHEYGHLIEGEGNGGNWGSINELVISEGKADTFARKVYPSVETSWNTPLEKNEKNEVLSVLEEEGNGYNADAYYTLERGNSNRNIPIASNYKIGAVIVEDYIENNNPSSVKEWIDLSPQQLIEKTSYEELLQ